MTLMTDDLRAAVAAGILNEKQAASVMQLADERQGYRAARSKDDEPFELFKGFNEIFIVVGLIILYFGWSALSSAWVSVVRTYSQSQGPLDFDKHMSAWSKLMTPIGFIEILVVIGLSLYFTRHRRMVAPSILLSILMSIGTAKLGTGLSGLLDLGANFVTISALTSAIGLFMYWYFFHIPFSLMLSAVAFFVLAVNITTGAGAAINDLEDFFLLSSDSTVSFITLGLGIAAFIFAMRFDLSDPHRVTRRAANGFWLHILAAPAIVNSIAFTLYSGTSALSYILLVAFLVLMTLTAIVIDRRSFLISGIGYMIALLIAGTEGQYGLVVLILGIGLVSLGAAWEKARCAILNTLPHFPGKSKLPPWKMAEKGAA